MNEGYEKNTVDTSLTEDEIKEMQREAEYQEFKQALEDANEELMSEATETEVAEEAVELSDGQIDDCDAVDCDSDFANEDLCEENPCEEVAEVEVVEEIEQVTAEESNVETIADVITENGATESEAGSEENFLEYKLKKVYSKISYDLSSPNLKTVDIRNRILDSVNYNFSSYSVLTAKLKAVKKQLKVEVDFCAVIGGIESTLQAKKCELREAKWLKAKQVEVQIPFHLIMEGNKRAVVKYLKTLKRIAGNKILLKCAVDATELDSVQFEFALKCILEAKIKRVVLKDYLKVNNAFVISLIKKCNGKCEIELDGQIDCLKPINYYGEIGVDNFAVTNAVALAEKIKVEME